MRFINASSCLLSSIWLLASCGGSQEPADDAATRSRITETAVGRAGARMTSLRASAPAVASPPKLWSDPATWGGVKPVAGAAVQIPPGMHVVLDESPPALAGVTIDGELSFKTDANVELQADWIRITASGALRAGAAGAPLTGTATITLKASDPTQSISGMGTRGILVEGGKLELFGLVPAVPWTRLNTHLEAGAKEVMLAAAPGWKVGDQLVIAPTSWYPSPWLPQAQQDALRQTELRTLTRVVGRSLRLSSAVSSFHWGRLQYVTDQGLALKPGVFTKPHPDAVDRIDERAEIANLSRNIVIQAPDDSLWRDNGFGAHVMAMGLASSIQLDGVELRRVGQAGRLGRYPLHWHLLSYAADGSFLGDANGHFVRNSAIWQSRQRCVVLHGTNGVQVANNICYDIKGHGIFLEDGVERRNVIEGNLVLQVRSPAPAQALTAHERAGHMCGASAGFWLTNPDNTVRGNAVADAQGNGFWLSYPRLPVKEGRNVPIRPRNLQHGEFEDNSARSNGNVGVMLECAMTDDAGNLELLAYEPTTTGAPFDWSNGVRFTLKGISTIKNYYGGYVNRAINPDYLRWTAADNQGRAFSGSVQLGSTLKQSLIVGSTLNNRQPYPTDADPQLGVASYHSAMDIAQNTFVNLSNRGYVRQTNGWDRSSGAFGTDDYYLRPLEKGMWRNAGNRLINADPGYRALPPHLQSNFSLASNNFWTLAGAIWDPHGYWAAAGSWWVYDVPFLREAACTPVQSKVPNGLANGLACPGPYFGIGDFELDRGLPSAAGGYTSFIDTVEATRLDAAGTPQAQWRVEAGWTSNFLPNMRHFTALRGASYVLRFPDFPGTAPNKRPPRWVTLWADNFIGDNDWILLGVHFDGSVVPSKVFVSTSPDSANWGVNSRALSPTASREAVLAGAGDLYWRDPANNLIWVKLMPLGLSAPWNNVEPGSDSDLYRSYALRIQ
jgi:hypothetical protein